MMKVKNDEEKFILVLSEPWTPLYDKDDDNKDDDNNNKDNDNKDDDNKDDDKSRFTTEQQKKVDEIVKTEKAKVKRNMEKQISQLEEFKKTANLTKKENEDLSLKIENMRKDFMTKEELAKVESEKSRKATNKQVSDLEKDRDTWKNRYTNSTIERALIDAAHETKAYNPEQILAILKPNTQLVEAMDDDGKATGNYEPKIDYTTTDKDGKSVKLTLTPLEAAKKMMEEERFANLFVSSTKGGLGSFTTKKPGDKGKDGFIKDTGDYIKDRRKTKLKK